MTEKRLSEAERLRLVRNGKTVCLICGDEMDAFGGGKTRKKYCSPKCKDRSRRKRINQDARAMGAECYRIWLALQGDHDAREQYVEWLMLLGTTAWRYAHMFRYRYSQARTVIIRQFGEADEREGQAALEGYLDRPTVKRWRVPSASLGIKTKRTTYGRELYEKDQEFKRFVETMNRNEKP
jgi:hypothetical protein